jgi:hypothetical protein
MLEAPSCKYHGCTKSISLRHSNAQTLALDQNLQQNKRRVLSIESAQEMFPGLPSAELDELCSEITRALSVKNTDDLKQLVEAAWKKTYTTNDQVLAMLVSYLCFWYL